MDTADIEPSLRITCRCCGSEEIRLWKQSSIGRSLTSEDLQITDSRYGATLELWRCRQCDFIFAESQQLNELIQLYENLDDSEYEDTQFARALQMRWLLKKVRKIFPYARSIIDVGAGAGVLLAEAKKMGFEVQGVEPSLRLVETAARLNKVEILHGVLPHPNLGEKKFDLVFAVDVIEHVTEPITMLRECAKLVGDGGGLVVVTPDVTSVPAKLLGYRWWHFRIAHVGYFGRNSLAKGLDRAGLRRIRQFRAKWFFPIGYLITRLARYLPIGALSRLPLTSKVCAWIYSRVIPINLCDSYVLVLQNKSL